MHLKRTPGAYGLWTPGMCTHKLTISPRAHRPERKGFATVVQLVSPNRSLGGDAGHNNSRPHRQKRRKRNDWARVHEPSNRTSGLDFLRYAELACLEDVLKTAEQSLHLNEHASRCQQRKQLEPIFYHIILVSDLAPRCKVRFIKYRK